MAQKNLQLGKLTLLNQSKPKIIAPIVATSFADSIKDAQTIDQSDAEIVEWRLDFLTAFTDFEQLTDAGKQIKEVINGRPLIVTNRTNVEGGNREYQEREYQESYIALINANVADAIDVEFSREDDVYNELLQICTDANIVLILSHHDFDETPDKNELIFLFAQMAKKKPSIVKVALTPHSREDVMTLMDATLAADNQIDQPIISMSMGLLGKISRIAGATFGSVATFASVGDASAPGQMSVGTLKEIFGSVE